MPLLNPETPQATLSRLRDELIAEAKRAPNADAANALKLAADNLEVARLAVLVVAQAKQALKALAERL